MSRNLTDLSLSRKICGGDVSSLGENGERRVYFLRMHRRNVMKDHHMVRSTTKLITYFKEENYYYYTCT